MEGNVAAMSYFSHLITTRLKLKFAGNHTLQSLLNNALINNFFPAATLLYIPSLNFSQMTLQ